MIMIGVYEQKLEEANLKKQIEYRFVPRTFYEEQLSKTNSVSNKLDNLFMKESPWFDRTVGPLLDIKKPE